MAAGDEGVAPGARRAAVRAERLGFGPEMRDQAIGTAQGELGRWVETAYAQAA